MLAIIRPHYWRVYLHKSLRGEAFCEVMAARLPEVSRFKAFIVD